MRTELFSEVLDMVETRIDASMHENSVLERDTQQLTPVQLSRTRDEPETGASPWLYSL